MRIVLSLFIHDYVFVEDETGPNHLATSDPQAVDKEVRLGWTSLPKDRALI